MPWSKKASARWQDAKTTKNSTATRYQVKRKLNSLVYPRRKIADESVVGRAWHHDLQHPHERRLSRLHKQKQKQKAGQRTSSIKPVRTAKNTHTCTHTHTQSHATKFQVVPFSPKIRGCSSKRATIEVYFELPLFGWNVFWRTGLLDPNSAEFYSIFRKNCCLFDYLRPWGLFIAENLASFSPPISFWVSYKRVPQK